MSDERDSIKQEDYFAARQRMITESQLQRRMADFQEKWAPTDRYHASRFQSELFMLVREIHRDAMEPVTQALLRSYSHINISQFPLADATKGDNNG